VRWDEHKRHYNIGPGIIMNPVCTSQALYIIQILPLSPSGNLTL
jgi:hypothetical protein